MNTSDLHPGALFIIYHLLPYEKCLAYKSRFS